MPYRFKARHPEGDPLALAAMLEVYANRQSLPDWMTPEQAAQTIRERFAEVLRLDLERIEIVPVRSDPNGKPATGEPPEGPSPPDAPF